MGIKFKKKSTDKDDSLVSREDILSSQDSKAWRHKKSDNKKKNRLIKSRIIVAIIALVLITAIGFGVYFWQKSKTAVDDKSNNDNVSKTQSENLVKIPDQQRTNIEGSIVLKGHALLQQYMAASVKVTGIDPALSKVDMPAAAIEDLKYISGATGQWSFSLSQDDMNKLKKGDHASYLKSNSAIGKSSDNYYIIFNFDSTGKINDILMSTTSKGMVK